MYFQKVGASRFCNAVYKPLLWKVSRTSKRTDITVRSSNNATVNIGRQASQPRLRGMKYMPDSRQNCLAQRARLSSNQAISKKPMTTKTKTFAIHNRLVSHS